MLANHQASDADEAPLSDSDYASILRALEETARGRSFLREFARRSRAMDTDTLLSAIGRIEGLLITRSLEPLPEADEEMSARQAETADALDARETAPSPVEDRPRPEAAAERNDDRAEPGETASTQRAVEAQPVAASAGPVEADLLASDIFEAETTSKPEASGEADTGAQPAESPFPAAIEYLGADNSDATEQKPEPPKHKPLLKPAKRDPFAEIRALSPEEKIALFT